MTAAPASENWSAGMVRFTGFAPVAVKVTAAELYEKAFGTKPEKESKSMKDFLSSAESPGDQLRRIDVRLERVDIMIVAQLNQSTGDGAFPVLGDATKSIAHICSLGNAVANYTGPFDRFAVGALCLIPAPDRTAAYQLLRDYAAIPFLDAATCADVQFRVNRPDSRKIGDHVVRINRMSTWAALALNLSGTPEGASKLSPVAHALQAELDINTAADTALSVVKPGIKVSDILDYLSNSATGLLNGGPAR